MGQAKSSRAQSPKVRDFSLIHTLKIVCKLNWVYVCILYKGKGGMTMPCPAHGTNTDATSTHPIIAPTVR